MRRCGACGEPHFSADTTNDYDCRVCGEVIGPERTEPTSGSKCSTMGPCSRLGFSPARHWCVRRDCVYHTGHAEAVIRLSERE